MKEKMIRIDWEDSCMDTGWKSRKEASTHSVSKCHSIGYQLRSNKREVVIYQSQSEDSGQVTEMMAIPRKAITKITELRERKR